MTRLKEARTGAGLAAGSARAPRFSFRQAQRGCSPAGLSQQRGGRPHELSASSPSEREKAGRPCRALQAATLAETAQKASKQAAASRLDVEPFPIPSLRQPDDRNSNQTRQATRDLQNFPPLPPSAQVLDAPRRHER
eukprot:scaffold1493_cov389-Pinguiococcus_pyrenoidosus.AAC.2